MKIAYWSSDYEKPKRFRNVPVGLTDTDSATENAGRGGMSLLERTTEPLMMGDNDPEQYKDHGKPKVEEPDKDEEEILSRVMELLVRVGDDMDNIEEYTLASFADYLILKFAQASAGTARDYSRVEKYNRLMLKINNSDMSDRNDTIKKLTNIYSRTLITEFSKHNDIGKAHQSAYSKALHRADQYLGDSSGANPQLEKDAQAWITNNPLLVAKQIKAIIDVMVGRMSPEAQQRAYPNLRGRISKLDVAELNSKKSPGGAAIGISITLVKSILNGRDPMFISAVISQLSKYL